MSPARRKARSILVRVGLLAGLWLLFSFALFLGLQVDPAWGDAGVAAIVILAALWAWLGRARGGSPRVPRG